MIEGKTIFLTGGAGFIGSTLVERLIDANRVVVFDSLFRDSLAERAVAKHRNLSLVVGDVLDANGLETAMKEAKPQIVVHLAAIAGIDTVIKSPTRTMLVNMMGTANALIAASHADGLERFVDFSTSEVFGSNAFRAVETGHASIGAVGEARWIYAVSKLAGEHLTHAYHHEFRMPTVTLRPFNVYGPGQVGEGAIHRFVVSALADEDLEIHGDGAQIRAWCYIDDMIDGLMLAMVHPNAVGESFNVGNARAIVTIYGLANAIIRVLGSKSMIRFVKKDYADIELRIPNVEKARELLSFEAAIDLEDGIRRTADYYRGKLSHSR